MNRLCTGLALLTAVTAWQPATLPRAKKRLWPIARRGKHQAVELAAQQVGDRNSPGHHDLVLMHVPYNFGHTVEKVAMFTKDTTSFDIFKYTMQAGGLFTARHKMTWEQAKKWLRPGGDVWGHFNPDLQEINKRTGCSMYFTPPKYWPEELAQRYFGNKTVFGLLRDPYERLVSMFRGNVNGYGGNFGKYAGMCNVNGAVKAMMKKYLAGGDKFTEECTFLPQAEYFDGPHGIRLPVDNRRFPVSMNEVFKAHGYTDRFIENKDILHVRGCENVWAADLDAETKSLVRQVYTRDFELLCKYFNYCDTAENTCIAGVPQMCPPTLVAKMKQKLNVSW